MSFYLDLTGFLAEPMATGIQRITGEICRYAPPRTVIPFRLHEGQCLALPPALVDAIGNYFRDASHSGTAEILKLGAVENGAPITFGRTDVALVAEILDAGRAAFFEKMSDDQLSSWRFVIYDLLPYTDPQFFPPGMPQAMAGYYRVIRRAERCGFISNYTRDTYYTRLKRTEVNGGVVLPLGSDSLGPRVTEPAYNRPLSFSVLGTIEPRKNHELILDAFEPLLRQVEGLTLSFIGRLGWVRRELQHKITMLSADPNSGLRFLSVLPDGEIQRQIQQSRATVYISEAEGYGLPPVESLWLGTPVISVAGMPSLQNLHSAGVHFVEPVTAANLRKAVLAFLDDAYTVRKIEETTTLNLPTWKSFAQEVIEWCA